MAAVLVRVLTGDNHESEKRGSEELHVVSSAASLLLNGAERSGA